MKQRANLLCKIVLLVQAAEEVPINVHDTRNKAELKEANSKEHILMVEEELSSREKCCFYSTYQLPVGSDSDAGCELRTSFFVVAIPCASKKIDSWLALKLKA